MVKRPQPKRATGTRPPRKAAAESAGERLQKILALAGFGSRRQAEELIQSGRVEVDRQVVTELGTKADLSLQEIRVDGVALRRPRLVYYAVNKPAGIVSTNRDPSGRPRVVDLLGETKERLFPVGRLDMASEGLILVTNDGELANRLTHPRYRVRKTYRVLVAGQPSREVLSQLRQGVHLAEGVARVAEIRIKRQQKQSAVLEMVLDEGKNREIRRVLARLGHKVLQLTRIAVGPVRLGQLASGEYRRLNREEIQRLKQLVRQTDRVER